MRLAASVAIVLITSCLVTKAIATECREDPEVVGQCFIAHGRIRVSASMLVELWPIGTKRLFHIPYTEKDPEHYLPANMLAKLRYDNEVFGDFEICPLEPDRPGHMRDACIQSASRLFVRDLPAGTFILPSSPAGTPR